MITLLGFLATLVSSVFYNWFLKNFEERNLLAIAMVVNCLGSVITLLYVKNIMFGMSPLVFVCLTTTVTDTVYLALS
jgi:Na+/melibiose symporter-like transporter